MPKKNLKKCLKNDLGKIYDKTKCVIFFNSIYKVIINCYNRKIVWVKFG